MPRPLIRDDCRLMRGALMRDTLAAAARRSDGAGNVAHGGAPRKEAVQNARKEQRCKKAVRGAVKIS